MKAHIPAPPWPVCSWCGAPALTVSPGTMECREAGLLLTRATPDVAACLDHALAIGWPWPSEERSNRHVTVLEKSGQRGRRSAPA